MTDDLPSNAFAKQDESDDLTFYAPPRLVTHIDDIAVAALTRFYRDMLPEGARVVDLMSSWVSHLPDDRRYAEVVGHGMNAEELAANPRLDRWFVQDLNVEPSLPIADQAFDAALCCVGAQYLQRPFESSPRSAGSSRQEGSSSAATRTVAFRQRPSRSGERLT